MAQMRNDAASSRVKELPITRSASPLRASPKRMAHSALPPTPTSMAMATMAIMNGFATVVAAKPLAPTACPTNTASMML